jgi:hypothetical protein
MAREKKSSDKTTPRKTAAKKSVASKAAVPEKSAAEELASRAPVVSPNLLNLDKAIRTTPPPVAELYEEIRRRAYEFYCERGGEHGSHEADWHRAESEVRSKYK